MESSKALEQLLEELRELHMIMDEIGQSIVDVESIADSVVRVGKSQSEGGAPADMSRTLSLASKSIALQDTDEKNGRDSVLKLPVDIEYRLLQKLRWKAESLCNVLKDTGQRMKDKYFSLRQLVSRYDGMLEKFSCTQAGEKTCFDTMKEKDMLSIEKYLLVRKEAIVVLVKCDEKLKTF